MSRFDYIKYDDISLSLQTQCKIAVEDLEGHIEGAVKCPRSKALALTKLEEVYAWIGKGIRNDQIERFNEYNTNEQLSLNEQRN